MSDLLSQIPLFGNLFDNTQAQTMQQIQANQKLYNGIDLPDFQNYNPEDYQAVGELNPEKADASLIQGDPQTLSAQRNALAQLAGLSQSGFSDVDQAGYQQARDIGNQMLSSGNAAALQSAQARGVGGSGLEFGMREMANQQGAQNAQNAALTQASNGAQMRANALNQYAMGLGNMYNQNYQQQAANAGILNQFNMANTNAQNYAQQYNLGNHQTIANQNVAGHNQAQQYNNQLQQDTFNNKMTRADGQSKANTAMANGFAAQNTDNAAGRNANTQLLFQAGGMLSGMGGSDDKKGGVMSDLGQIGSFAALA